MSEYSKFGPGDEAELICPACGAVLTDKERVDKGWNCKCGDFIPESMVINPFKGISNQHKQNSSWR